MPQLATLLENLPRGDNWRYELKYDGYRIFAFIHNTGVKLLTRNQLDWTRKFQFDTKQLLKLPHNTLLDGEIVALDESNRINFSTLQKAVKGKKSSKLQYIIFDIVFFNGRDLRKLSLQSRRSKLQSSFKESKAVAIAPQYKEDSLEKLVKEVKRKGIEGIVAKDIEANYSSGRTRSWLKVKFNLHEEFCIIGYTKHSKSSRSIGALLLGLKAGKESYLYCGKVGTGFSTKERQSLFLELSTNCKGQPNISNKHLLPRDKFICKPKLVCEIVFAEWTSDKLLRQARYMGLRSDKSPEDVSILNSSIGIRKRGK